MKSLIYPHLRTWIFVLGGFFLLLNASAFAQGSPAQSSVAEESLQSKPTPVHRQLRKQVLPTQTPEANLIAQKPAPQVEAWEKILQTRLRPAQPHRPVPLVLVLVGLVVLLASLGLSVLAYFLIGVGFPLGILTLFLWLVFGVFGILGILLMISGLIVALAGSKKRKNAAPPDSGQN